MAEQRSGSVSRDAFSILLKETTAGYCRDIEWYFGDDCEFKHRRKYCPGKNEYLNIWNYSVSVVHGHVLKL